MAHQALLQAFWGTIRTRLEERLRRVNHYYDYDFAEESSQRTVSHHHLGIILI